MDHILQYNNNNNINNKKRRKVCVDGFSFIPLEKNIFLIKEKNPFILVFAFHMMIKKQKRKICAIDCENNQKCIDI